MLSKLMNRIMCAGTVVVLFMWGCDSGATRNNYTRCIEDLEQSNKQTNIAIATAQDAIDLAKQFEAQLDYAARKYHFSRKDLP